MKKVTMVKTDDPKKARFTVVVKGSVEKIAIIEPRSVYLEGLPGNTLETIIKITPVEKYKFSILGVEQKVNTNIQASLIAPGKDEKSWQVLIKASSDKPGQVYDLLTFKTDSKYRPLLSIRVYAQFVEKKKTGS